MFLRPLIFLSFIFYAPILYTAEGSGELPWVSGQARGYTLLSLMQPEGRQSAEAQIEIMLESKVRELKLGVLIDGTFSWDPEYLKDVIRRLNSDGRTLTLVLYITNGPSQRIYDETPIDDVPFVTTPPEDFRELIMNDEATRKQFIELVERSRKPFELNRKLNPDNRNIAIVMLEDNLTNESYASMRDLAHEQLGDLVEFARNPCRRCYDEDSQALAMGDLFEMHRPHEFERMRPGDGFSFDGLGLLHPFEEGVSEDDPNYVEGVRPGRTRNLIERTLEREFAYVGLWRFDRQGLHEGELVHPKDRTYVVPMPEHRAAEIELMRFGLSPAD